MALALQGGKDFKTPLPLQIWHVVLSSWRSHNTCKSGEMAHHRQGVVDKGADPKVGNLHSAIAAEQEVCGLDVAMHLTGGKITPGVSWVIHTGGWGGSRAWIYSSG